MNERCIFRFLKVLCLERECAGVGREGEVIARGACESFDWHNITATTSNPDSQCGIED